MKDQDIRTQLRGIFGEASDAAVYIQKLERALLAIAENSTCSVSREVAKRAVVAQVTQ